MSAANPLGHAYDTAAPPSEGDVRYWDTELGLLFQYQPPDLRAPANVPEHKGWGFPAHLRPPADCYEYAKANFIREVLQQRLNDDRGRPRALRPDYKYGLLACLTGLFTWLRSMDGTKWLLKLYGISLVEPHPGYAYFYEPNPGEAYRLVGPDFGLRIFKRDSLSRTMKSPIEYCGKELLDTLKKILEERRAPARHPISHNTLGMWEWSAAVFRTWLSEKAPDLSWPTSKPDRISGYQWARNVLRPGSQVEKVWNVIEQAEVYDPFCYRIQKPGYVEVIEAGVRRRVQPERAGVIWTGKQNMRFVPLDDLLKHEARTSGGGEQALATIRKRFTCASCDNEMCCTSGNDRLCMHCRGVQLETDHRPSLNWCTYRECKMCPEHLRTADDYVNLITRLNTETPRRR